jgi:ATP-binding cassette subfamily B multidrug efflux pump
MAEACGVDTKVPCRISISALNRTQISARDEAFLWFYRAESVRQYFGEGRPSKLYVWTLKLSSNAPRSAYSPGDAMSHVVAAQQGKGLTTLWRIMVLTWRHPWMVIITILSCFISSALQLWTPLLLGQAVDRAEGVLDGGVGAAEALWTIAVILLVVSVFRGLFTMSMNYFGESVGHHVGYELRLAFYDKVQRLSYSYHDKVHSGDLITLGMLDLDGVRMFFSTGFVRTILLTVLIGVGAYMLLSTDWLLGLLALSFVPFVAWRSSVTQLTLRATWLVLQEKLSALTRVMEENLGGIRVVRALLGAKNSSSTSSRARPRKRFTWRMSASAFACATTSAMTFSFFVRWAWCSGSAATR